MFDKLFTKANLHALLVAIIVGGATALQAALASGTWTWHALLFGLVGGILSAAAGWLIRTLNGGPPPAAAAVVLLAGLTGLLASCSPPQASAAPVMRAGPIGLAGVLAPGDSLGPYTFAVPAVSGAGGYSWTLTVSATNGSWSNLPTNAGTTAPSFGFTIAAAGGVWDSVSLQLCVKGTSAVRSSKGTACTSWKVYRYLASPTALTGDSSKLGPISMMLRSPTEDSLYRNGSGVYAHAVTRGTALFCAFIRFGSGHVAGITPTSSCATVAPANFLSTRLGALTSAEAGWLSGSCLTWPSCLSGLGAVRAPRDALLIHVA